MASAHEQQTRDWHRQMVGYQGFGSFHSPNVEVLVAQAADEYRAPPVPASAVESTIASLATRHAPEFGSELLKRQEFLLDPDWTFLNHGAFGAPSRVVAGVADEWRAYCERQPLRFIDREVRERAHV